MYLIMKILSRASFYSFDKYLYVPSSFPEGTCVEIENRTHQNSNLNRLVDMRNTENILIVKLDCIEVEYVSLDEKTRDVPYSLIAHSIRRAS